jgi:hypothetical protein
MVVDEFDPVHCFCALPAVQQHRCPVLLLLLLLLPLLSVSGLYLACRTRPASISSSGYM